MDTIIFFLTVDGKSIKYYAKSYRENSNIVWYNPTIEEYEIFNNVNEWPIVEKDVLEEINFAVQVNGKTRDIIKIRKDSVEEMVNKKVLIESKARKYIKDKKIVKTIFVNNKIINYIVSS